MATKGQAGGAATAGGMNFQHRATAWVAVRILAEAEASPPWGLSAGTTLEWLRCETEQPVDDLMVKTSQDGLILAQIKHTLQLSTGPDSPFASALDQCVRQFIAHQTGAPGKQPWERPLNPAQDRLVLITSPTSSAPIRIHLSAVLGKLHHLVEGQPLHDAISNTAERDVLSAVVSHLQRSWQAALGVSPSELELRSLLLPLRVHVLDVDPGGANEQEAKDCLRTTILCNLGHTDLAWARMIEFCARLAAERSGVDRKGLQQLLLSAGIDLKAPRSYCQDIECLRAHTRSTASLLSQLARIRIGTTEIKIDRPSTDALRHAAEEASLLVIGEPGAGKSGALHNLTNKLIEEGRDVIFLAVDHFAARSLGELRGELGLERSLTDVLANWAGTTPAFLVIDALDAARSDPAAKAFRDLIQTVAQEPERWRVVASIREFDLRYSQDLQQLFMGEPHQVFRDKHLPRVRHLQVPRLSPEEMAQIPPQSPALQALLDRAPAVLRELLHVPFNLRLMAELLGEGVDPVDLTPIQTQLELLDRYWRHRIVRHDGQRDAREGLLRHACEEMVTARVRRGAVHLASESTARPARVYRGPFHRLR